MAARAPSPGHAAPAPSLRRRLGLGLHLTPAALVLAVLIGPAAAQAHEFRPALLDIQWVDDVAFDVAWKSLAGNDTAHGQPAFAEGCTVADSSSERSDAGAIGAATGTTELFRARVSCPDVSPIVVTVPPDPRRAEVVVRVRIPDGTEILDTLPRGALTYALPAGAAPETTGVFARYLVLGVEHILAGWDHLLFVLCLMLVVRRPGALVRAITGFTVGHSITLALATLGGLSLPGPPVEATIALSIIFLAREVVALAGSARAGVAASHPGAVAAAFGLLHGFGFAGVLAALGIPAGARAMALLSFNVGVELGQLAFVVVALGPLVGLARLGGDRLSRTLPAYGAGIIGAYWLVERVLAFGGS